jgi:hypothetical protein
MTLLRQNVQAHLNKVACLLDISASNVIRQAFVAYNKEKKIVENDEAWRKVTRTVFDRRRKRTFTCYHNMIFGPFSLFLLMTLTKLAWLRWVPQHPDSSEHRRRMPEKPSSSGDWWPWPNWNGRVCVVSVALFQLVEVGGTRRGLERVGVWRSVSRKPRATGAVTKGVDREDFSVGEVWWSWSTDRYGCGGVWIGGDGPSDSHADAPIWFNFRFSSKRVTPIKRDHVVVQLDFGYGRCCAAWELVLD